MILRSQCFELLGQAIVLDPAFSGARILAELFRATGQNEKSEQAYAEAIAVSPDQADLRYGHALSLVRRKALPDAIRELELAVRLDPGNSPVKDDACHRARCGRSD